MVDLYGQYTALINALDIKGFKFPPLINILIADLDTETQNYLRKTGYHDASGGTVPTDSPNVGEYWIITVAGTILTIDYYENDWIVWNGVAWERVNNQGAFGDAPPEDIAYDAGTWNNNQSSATKNVIRDEIEDHYALPNVHHTQPTVSDDAYGAGWNADTNAATKNAIYDKVLAMDNLITNASNSLAAVAGLADDVVGTIRPSILKETPSGWLVCDGSAISRTTYSDLFGVIGTVFGLGDQQESFNIPDFRGRFPRGADLGSGNDQDADSRSSSNKGDGDTYNFTITGDILNLNTKVSNISAGDIAKLGVGQGVSATGILIGRRIASIHSDYIHLDGSAAGTGTRTITIYPSMTANCYNGSNTMDNISAADIANLSIGMSVLGQSSWNFIPADTVITSIGSNSITISNNATGDSGSNTFILSSGTVLEYVGSAQDDALVEHTHDVHIGSGGYPLWSFFPNESFKNINVWANGFNINGGTNVGSDTRPENLYVDYIIKYE